jgi:hypothetical protein
MIFHGVSLTFPHNNIPTEVGYNVFFSQVVRYGNICTGFDIFTSHLHKIFKILVDRGYYRGKLINNIQVSVRKYNIARRKFGILDDT